MRCERHVVLGPVPRIRAARWLPWRRWSCRPRGRAPLAILTIGIVSLFVAACGSSGGSGGRLPLLADDPPGYRWQLPAGFPIPEVPRDNPMSEEKVELGRRLFFDTRLSVNESFACASCHRPELAFTDGKPKAVGATGQVHPRGSMSLANVAYNLSFNWGDPQKKSLEEQMRVPMFGDRPVELGLGGLERQLVQRLESDLIYPDAFDRAFPEASSSVSIKNVIRAIAAFERTIISGNSLYDRWVFWGEEDALSPAARRGMELFFSKRTQCGRCHATFNLSGAIEFVGAAPARPDFHNTGLYNTDGNGSYPRRNRGVWEFTRRTQDMGRFRPPTLRNIEVTAPYMHDGSVETLEDVIAHYAAGGRAGRDHPLKSELLSGFEITEQETEDLIAFLKSLTDREFLSDPRFSDPDR